MVQVLSDLVPMVVRELESVDPRVLLLEKHEIQVLQRLVDLAKLVLKICVNVIDSRL